MNELIENLANNNTVIIGLSVLLGILVILFIIMLFSGKGKKSKNEDTTNKNIEVNSSSNNIDFDHSEYVKETTAEFELTPITEVSPTPDEFVPNVSAEESPAIDNSKNVENVPLADFNFDELSKSISEELDRLKEEDYNQAVEVAPSEEIKDEAPRTDVVDAFKEVEPEFQTLEVSKFEDIVSPSINSSEGVVTPAPITSEPSFITDINDIPIKSEEPKPAEIPEPVLERPVVSEPVIKEEEVPLFARFNQETYDINKKD